MTVETRSKSIKTETTAKETKKLKLPMKTLAWAAVLLFAAGVNIAFLECKHFTGRKIDANQIRSPWEYSSAPPQGFNKKLIVVHSAPKINVQSTSGNHPKYKLIQAGSAKMVAKAKPAQGASKSRQKTAFAFAQKTYNKNLTQ
jgi:hypothetical protein